MAISSVPTWMEDLEEEDLILSKNLFCIVVLSKTGRKLWCDLSNCETALG